MSKQHNKLKSEGFTIIEVLIVLAIAALILLVVFLAVPALQRSQRNNGRQSEAARLSTQIVSFISNNQANLPGWDPSSSTYLAANSKTDAKNFVTNFGNFKYLVGIAITTSNGQITSATSDLVPNSIQIFNGTTLGATTITPVAVTTVEMDTNGAASTNRLDEIGIFEGNLCGTGGATTMSLPVGTASNIALVYTTETSTKGYNLACIQTQ
ncbi:MAG: prepilin-type N-terminal cleavage/methylation domain-containing protein [bacterium]